MKKIAYILFFYVRLSAFFCSPSLSCFSGTILLCGMTFGVFAQQPTQEWVKRFTNGNYANGLSVQLDSAGNVYVLVGTRFADTTNGDYYVLKYNSGGTLLWSTYYNSPGNLSDQPKAFVVSGAGDVFVTGKTNINFTSYVTTVKFNANGILQWARVYDGGWQSSSAVDISLDRAGNIAICGGTLVNSSLSVGYIIKYNSYGDSLWVKKYNPTQKHNFFAKLAIDNLDNIVVTGYFDFGTNVDYLVVKYLPDGNMSWDVTYDSPQHYNDGAMYIALDTNRNIYTVGTSAVPSASANNILVKLNTGGTIQWAQIFTGVLSGEGRCQYPAGVVTTPDGNSIYYTTFCSNGTGGGGYDIVTLKYISTGDTQWVKRYWGGVNGTPNEPADLKLDKDNNVYVTGATYYPVSGGNITAIKYLLNGTQQWVATYNGPLTNSFDYAHALIIDTSFEVYVTGISSRYNGNPILWDAVTIKYSQPIGIINNNNELPIAYRLEQNYPNPFNPTTQIDYQVPKKSFVKLVLFNILGQEIRTLIQTQQSSGNYSILLDAEDLSSGIYFYSLIVEGKLIDSKKLILMK